MLQFAGDAQPFVSGGLRLRSSGPVVQVPVCRGA